MKLKIGDEEITDSGKLFSEATFISETEAGKCRLTCSQVHSLNSTTTATQS